MEKFLPYYERELGSLQRLGREFAARFPRLAGNLALSGDTSADPHIEHLIQAVAFFNARTAKLLDDDYATFTEALLGLLYPHVLRPLPACSIARIDNDGLQALSGLRVVPRGTELRSAGAAPVCRFRTAYDVGIVPLRVAALRFAPCIDAPATARLPPGVTASIALVLESGARGQDLAQLARVQPAILPPSLRLFIDAEAALCAALRDSLFLHAAGAYVELDGNGRWIALDAVPLAAAGFAPEDALLPSQPGEQPAYRLLTEYFSFPDKFNFIDLDLRTLLAPLSAATSCARLTLHLPLLGLRSESSRAQLLKSLAAEHLLTGCTPVVNLFRQAAAPVKLTQLQSSYPLLPDDKPSAAFEIYSVDSVQLLRKSARGAGATAFYPYYSLRHGDNGGPARQYWLTRRDEDIAAASPGQEMSIAFVQRDLAPLQIDGGTASISLTCSNRDLPSMLACGRPGGDLFGELMGACPIRLLRRPSATRRLASARGGHWALVAQLALNHRAFGDDGLDAFTAMLRLYAPPGCAASQRQIDGIAGLRHRAVNAWLSDGVARAYVGGVELGVSIAEDAFAASSLHLFGQLLSHFFGLHVHVNSFTQLVLLSASSGKELLRCPPRNGDLALA